VAWNSSLLYLTGMKATAIRCALRQNGKPTVCMKLMCDTYHKCQAAMWGNLSYVLSTLVWQQQSKVHREDFSKMKRTNSEKMHVASKFFWRSKRLQSLFYLQALNFLALKRKFTHISQLSNLWVRGKCELLKSGPLHNNAHGRGQKIVQGFGGKARRKEATRKTKA
jgi:hypothetical protein